MTELLTGLPPEAPAGAVPRTEFDPATQTLTRREAAKAVELSAETGRRVSPHTVRWRRRRYQQQGVLGMATGMQLRAARRRGRSIRGWWVCCGS